MEDLIYFDISDTYSGNVTSMNGMFNRCKSIVEIDMTQIDTSSVIEMETMFVNCYSLHSLDLSSFDTSNVENMNRMFANPSDLDDEGVGLTELYCIFMSSDIDKLVISKKMKNKLGSDELEFFKLGELIVK